MTSRREFLKVPVLCVVAPGMLLAKPEVEDLPAPEKIEFDDVVSDLRFRGPFPEDRRALNVNILLAEEDARFMAVIGNRDIRLMVATTRGLSLFWVNQKGARLRCTHLPEKNWNWGVDTLYDGTPIRDFYFGNGDLKFPACFPLCKNVKFVGRHGYSTGRWSSHASSQSK